jgi:hypothetical protein
MTEMESTFHRFSELFTQLGLSPRPTDIATFLQAHAPLAAGTRLEDAPCWSPAQARLLKEEILKDADWAEVVDHLNLALRQVKEQHG